MFAAQGRAPQSGNQPSRSARRSVLRAWEAVPRIASAVSMVAVLVSVGKWWAEADQRQNQTRYQAWQVIHAARGTRYSRPRIDALEYLSAAGERLDRMDLSQLDLRGIRLPARTSGARGSRTQNCSSPVSREPCCAERALTARASPERTCSGPVWLPPHSRAPAFFSQTSGAPIFEREPGHGAAHTKSGTR